MDKKCKVCDDDCDYGLCWYHSRLAIKYTYPEMVYMRNQERGKYMSDVEIKGIIIEAGFQMTKVKLADRLSIHPSKINKWLCGHMRMTLRDHKRIRVILDEIHNPEQDTTS